MSSTHFIFLPSAKESWLFVVSFLKNRTQPAERASVMRFRLASRLARKILYSTYRLLKLPGNLGTFFCLAYGGDWGVRCRVTTTAVISNGF